uniref:Retrotransposon Gag domain-containing protein n=1 Tax=Tanacetum cinerariifolium TaxID=118510 RepID=A0A6L2NKR9_TANCI|nr:retrotransposon Gag domain-containing protein [Tanacetum cinerariifolium]
MHLTSASEDHTPDRSLENTSEDPVMQFVVQNFEQINAMYSTFSSKRKELNPTSAYSNDEHPVVEPWRSDSEGSHEDEIRRAPEENTLQAKPSKKSRPGRSPYNIHGNYGSAQATRTGLVSFLSHYLKWGCSILVRQLATGKYKHFSLAERQVPSKLLAAKKIPKSASRNPWDPATLRPGRFFKDLIAQPPVSMEDVFTQAHNFIRADEANTKNRLRDVKLGATDKRHMQNYRESTRKHKERYAAHPATRPNERSSMHRPIFIPLIKSPAEIYVTSEGKSVLRPPSWMFAPAHRRDRSWFYEFHNDHGYDMNDCVDLRKEIEACVRNGRLSHLAKGAKA